MGFREIEGGYDTVCHFSMEMKYNSASEVIVFLQETGTEVWAAGEPVKEMPFEKGFSSTVTA